MQKSSIRMSEMNLSQDRTMPSYLGYIAFIYSFCLFTPYPAIPVGNYTGIQVAHILTIFFLFVYGADIAGAKKVILIYSFLMIPPIISFALDPSNVINLNATIALALALLVIVVASHFIISSFHMCVYGAAVAIGLHGIVGLVQQYFYLSERFPLLELYINPSFAPIDDGITWQIYAFYTKRSFGLLPEPSAMFASIAPWLVLITALLFDPKSAIRSRISVDKWMYLVFALGFILVFFGRSGGTPVLILGVAPIIFRYTVTNLKTGSLKGWLAFLFVLILFVSISFFIYFDLQDRVSDEVQKAGSWEERMATIAYSFQALFEGDLLDALFGFGMGATSQMTLAATGSPGVHSWIFGYMMGTGVVGFLCLLSVLYVVFLSIFQSKTSALGIGIFIIWLFCATVVTGYLQLLAMWGMFALLINWKQLFD